MDYYPSGTILLKENGRPQGIIFEMNGNCRKNINCEESIKKSSYFSANQIEKYQNTPELNIRPPSCDVKRYCLPNLVPRVSLLCLPWSLERGRQRRETLGTRLMLTPYALVMRAQADHPMCLWFKRIFEGYE